MVRYVTCLLCIAAIGAAAFAQSAPASAPTSASIRTPGKIVATEYIDLAELLKLDDKTVDQLNDKAGDTNAAISKFVDDNPAWRQAGKDSTSKDPNVAAKARADMAKYQDQMDALVADHEAKAMAILTPAQRLAWDEYTLNKLMVAKFSKTTVAHGPSGQMEAKVVAPDAASLKTIKQLSADTAAALQKLPNPYDVKARQKMIDELAAKLKTRLAPSPTGNAPTE